MQKSVFVFLILILSAGGWFPVAAQDEDVCGPDQFNETVSDLFALYDEASAEDPVVAARNLQAALDELLILCENRPAPRDTSFLIEGKWIRDWDRSEQTCPDGSVISWPDTTVILSYDEVNDVIISEDAVNVPLEYTLAIGGVYTGVRNETLADGRRVTYNFRIFSEGNDLLTGTANFFLSGALPESDLGEGGAELEEGPASVPETDPETGEPEVAVTCSLLNTFQLYLVDESIQCLVIAPAGSNVRAEPSTDASRVGELPRGAIREVDGQALDSEGIVWWRLRDSAWVRSDLVRPTSGCSGVAALG